MSTVRYKNDEYMIYDLETHKYKLTENAINHLSAYADIKSDMDMMLNMISNTFYTEAMRFAIDKNKYLHYLAQPSNRANIKEAMIMIAEDLSINRHAPGTNYIKNQKDKLNVLVSKRVARFLLATDLQTRQAIIFHSYLTDVKGVDW